MSTVRYARSNQMRGRGTTHFAVAVLIAGAFAGSLAGTTSASASASRVAGAAGCPAWTPVPSGNPYPGEDALQGVAVLSASNVWAVGSKSKLSEGNAVFKTLIEHWNGHSWKVIPSPNPGAGDNLLSSVTAVSANNIWAVGGYSNMAIGLDKNLILHWNGHSWKQVASPNPGSSFNDLATIRQVSAASIWIVGDYAGSDFHDRSLILHWNGHAWKQVPSPNPGKSSNILQGLAVVSASSIWTDEQFTTADASTSQILHWNGHVWRKAAAGPAGSDLVDVSASSASNAWAVGTDIKGRSLALHWNGHSWKRVPTPNLDPKKLINAPQSVTVVSPTSAWMVGAAQNFFSVFEGTAIEMHWNGHKWSMMKSPNNPGADSALFGVQATPTVSPWAVGEFGNSIMVQRTWILRCR
jgi:hypothetical protein